MKRFLSKRGVETGQVIPIVALMMIAIVGMVALLIDGGSLMSDRRTAQAAADAAALAGARSLCSDNEADALSTAHTYAINNKASSSVETIVSSVLISDHEVKGINVQTTVANPSFFAGILDRILFWRELLPPPGVTIHPLPHT